MFLQMPAVSWAGIHPCGTEDYGLETKVEKNGMKSRNLVANSQKQFCYGCEGPSGSVVIKLGKALRLLMDFQGTVGCNENH